MLLVHSLECDDVVFLGADDRDVLTQVLADAKDGALTSQIHRTPDSRRGNRNSRRTNEFAPRGTELRPDS